MAPVPARHRGRPLPSYSRRSRFLRRPGHALLACVGIAPPAYPRRPIRFVARRSGVATRPRRSDLRRDPEHMTSPQRRHEEEKA